jgi:hypothetical protein
MEETQVVPTEEVAQVVEETKEETKTEEVVETKAEEVVEPPKPKKSAQERIDELTRKRRDAERDAEYWKAKALQKEPVPEAPVATSIPKRPTLDQFENTEQYEDALFEWRDKKRDIETRSAKQAEEFNRDLRTFNENARKLREEHEDFDDVIEQPVFSPDMRKALLKSENGPVVAYHLGRPENRDLAERILALPVESQLYEIGKLESKLLLAQSTKKVTSAPPPIKPVGMGGGGEEQEPTGDAWYERERQRELERIKNRYAKKYG